MNGALPAACTLTLFTVKTFSMATRMKIVNISQYKGLYALRWECWCLVISHPGTLILHLIQGNIVSEQDSVKIVFVHLRSVSLVIIWLELDLLRSLHSPGLIRVLNSNQWSLDFCYVMFPLVMARKIHFSFMLSACCLPWNSAWSMTILVGSKIQGGLFCVTDSTLF